MNKILSLFIVVMLMAFPVMAVEPENYAEKRCYEYGMENYGYPLYGVEKFRYTAHPEHTYVPLDFAPPGVEIHVHGPADGTEFEWHSNIPIAKVLTMQDGYTLYGHDGGESGYVEADDPAVMWVYFCSREHIVPEFSTIGAVVAGVSVLGFVFLTRKN